MPPSRRLIVRAGFREVVGYDLGRGRRHFREARLERLSGARVQHLPPSAQQAAVRRVAHQRVLEQVAVAAAREHQLGHGQLRQGLVQRRLRQVGDRRQQPAAELAPDHRGGLRHVLHVGQPVEAGHERVVQRARDRERRGVGLGEAGLQHRLGQLLDEQRHAVRFGHNLRHEGAWQVPLAGKPAGQRRRLLPAKAA